ncbi:MAG: ABC transporter ATP-binding protein/permease [Desulfocapsa sp.]|nr:ABC transporter ATP-binding protein/permease [Desulfocapsa sp.]MBN4048720.1 ABC transporter ATP-binding protein/permease [bacterium AH-315-N22]
MKKTAIDSSVRITQRSLFYWILRRHRLMQLFLLLIIVVSLFFKVFPLEMQKRIINEAIYLKDVHLLYLYCGLYIGAVTIAGLLKYGINVLQVYIGQKILIEMREELYQHVLQLPLQFYRKMQAGTVISAMTAELNAIGFFLGGAIAIPITSILTFAVFVGFMFNLNPLLAFLSMGIYPFELVVIPFLQKKYNKLNSKRVKTTRSMANVVNESISGIHEIHGNTSYGLEEKKLSSYIRQLYALMKKLFIVKYGIKFVNNFFQSLGPFILFLVGGYMAINGQFTLGALVAFLSAYEKVYDPWKELIEYYQSYQDAQIRYRQIMQIFDMDPPHLLLPPGREPLTLQGDISLKNVTFTVSSGVRLLEDINFDIKSNEQIALVGYSGSGKSTLALLIAQLYDSSQGSIDIGGSSIEDLCKMDIGKNVAMISQHPFIFSGTISDNLLYGIQAIANDCDKKIPDRAKILSVIRDVGLQDDIIRFGLQAVLSPEECRPFRDKFLRMREIVQTALRDEFASAIEFYDATKYLHYSNIRDNIVFGDSLNGEFIIERLPDHPRFIQLLCEVKLEKPLVTLGFTIATQTVNLLADFQEDEFFFRDNPMESKEFGAYSELLARLSSPQPNDEEARRLLLILALRFIPGKHSIVSLPSAIERKILAARHRFQETILHIDMAHCKKYGSSIPCRKLPRCGDESDFVPFCPNEYLYTRTLLDNILFGAVKSEQFLGDHLRILATQAFQDEKLLDEVMDIGLSFEVGSKGDRLSGGQKQKLAIARAFLKDAPILIMDEATASLDNTSQARIQSLLENEFKGKKTIIAVIHRLDLTPAYDRIIVLKAGRIVEQGTYDQLMERKGDFYELARAEF